METSAQNAISNALRQVFVASQVKNPAYSLRSFAKRLGISPSAVSEILNGKRRVSRKLAERLTEKLALDPMQRNDLLALFDRAGGTGGAGAAPQTKLTVEYELVDADKFNLIAEWYHFAILSLMETKDFDDDPAWIAGRLNIKARDATAALDRLTRLGLVKRVRGKLAMTHARLTTTDGERNLSLQRSHAANLELAKASLVEDDVDERDFCATVMAIDPAKLPQAKKMIRDFSDRLAAFLETPGKQTEVYNLSLQLFPLSR